VDVLRTFGITTGDAAQRQQTTHQVLAALLGTSAPTISRIVQVGLAQRVLEEAGVPDRKGGGLCKVVWLSQNGVRIAPAVVEGNIWDAAVNFASISGYAHVTMKASPEGSLTIGPWSSEKWQPEKRTAVATCPDCTREGKKTPGACKKHWWANSLLWGFDAKPVGPVK